MKKILTIIASMLFVVSCASTSVDQSKVAKNEEAKEEKSSSSSSSRSGCRKSTGSRLQKKNC